MLTYPIADSILEQDYASDVCHGSPLVPGEIGAVAVIDGSMYPFFEIIIAKRLFSNST